LLGADERPLDLTCDLFAEEVVARWVPVATERGVTLRTAGLDHVGLRCSAMDAHDMVDELVENALRYAGPGAEVVLTLAVDAVDAVDAVKPTAATDPAVRAARPSSAGRSRTSGPARPSGTTPVAVVTVTDTGPGLPVGDLGRAVERFWRAPGQRADGTGLGLAIVAQLARANHGRLELDHHTPRGLLARLVIPTVDDV
ncbi:MAG: sensor histidine kinase, partial [Phycicoccus sp.]